MIEIRYLQAESGANKFGTCNCCGKSSGEDPLMISVKFNYCGHGMTICLCDDCKKKLIEALSPANNSEIPNSSDTISRQAAIDRATKEHDFFRGAVTVSDKARRDELLNVICWLGELPPIQPERIKARWLPIGIADAVGGESAMWGDEIAYHACDNCWQQALEKDGEEVLSDFCPHCGADMRGEDNETD